MKQVKVKNERLQKSLDSIHGWKEVALVLLGIALTAIALIIATKVSAM